MMYNSVSDEAKNNSDLYVTLEKIREMNPMVPGVYVNLAELKELIMILQLNLNSEFHFQHS